MNNNQQAKPEQILDFITTDLRDRAKICDQVSKWAARAKLHYEAAAKSVDAGEWEESDMNVEEAEDILRQIAFDLSPIRPGKFDV